MDGGGDSAPGAGGGLPLPGHRRVRPQPGGLRLPRRDHLRPVRRARVPQPDERHSAKAHSGPHHLRPGGRVGGLPLRRRVPLSENRAHRPVGGGCGSAGELRAQVEPGGERLDGGAGLGEPPQRVRPALLRGGPGPAGPAQHAAASGGPAPGGPAEEPGQDGPGAGGRPLRLSGGGGGAGAAGPAHRGAEPPGTGRAGGGVCPALGDPLRRPGAVRPDPGGRPHGAGRVLQALCPGALPVRRGLHPRVPGPGECGRHAPPGPPGLPGGIPAGGGRRGHPRRRAVAGAAQRRRPEPAGLLRAGVGPPAVRQAVPGDDHCVRDLRPAPAALLCELGGGRAGRGGAAALLPPVQAKFPVPPGPAGGGGAAGRLLPAGGPPARPGAGGAVPPGRGGPARPAGIRPPGGADGAGRPDGAGTAHPPGGGRPLWYPLREAAGAGPPRPL